MRTQNRHMCSSRSIQGLSLRCKWLAVYIKTIYLFIIGLCSIASVISCGDPMVDGAYLGEPFATISVITQSYQTQLTEDDEMPLESSQEACIDDIDF